MVVVACCSSSGDGHVHIWKLAPVTKPARCFGVNTTKLLEVDFICRLVIKYTIIFQVFLSKVWFEPGSMRFSRCKISLNLELDIRFGSTKLPNLEPNFGLVQQSSEPNCGNPKY